MAFNIKNLRRKRRSVDGGKVLLSQLSDSELDELLSRSKLEKFTPASRIHRKKYKTMIKKARQEGVASEDEEHIEGVRALALKEVAERIEVRFS